MRKYAIQGNILCSGKNSHKAPWNSTVSVSGRRAGTKLSDFAYRNSRRKNTRSKVPVSDGQMEEKI